MSPLVIFVAAVAMFAAPSLQDAGHPAVTSCVHSPPLPDKVSIDGCNSGRCSFKTGSVITGELEFTTRQKVVSPAVDAWGYKWWIYKKIDTSDVDVCSIVSPKLESGCSLNGKTKYMIELNLPIPTSTPTGNIDAEIYIKDRSNDDTVNCFRISVNFYD